jgi:hypothetical protein
MLFSDVPCLPSSYWGSPASPMTSRNPRLRQGAKSEPPRPAMESQSHHQKHLPGPSMAPLEHLPGRNFPMGTHGKAEKTHQSSGKQDKHDLKPIYIYS